MHDAGEAAYSTSGFSEFSRGSANALDTQGLVETTGRRIAAHHQDLSGTQRYKVKCFLVF